MKRRIEHVQQNMFLNSLKLISSISYDKRVAGRKTAALRWLAWSLRSRSITLTSLTEKYCAQGQIAFFSSSEPSTLTAILTPLRSCCRISTKLPYAPVSFCTSRERLQKIVGHTRLIATYAASLFEHSKRISWTW